MTRLYIMGRDEAIVAVGEERIDPSAIVSITAPGDRPPPLFSSWLRCPLIHLAFDDIPCSAHGYVAATREDIARLIAPTRMVGDIVVHCAAGISRSSAAALTIRAAEQRAMWTNTGDWSAPEFDPHRRGAADRALAAVLADADATRAAKLRGDNNIWPNPRIVWLADGLLDYRGGLIRAVGRAFNLPPYRFYDQIREPMPADLPLEWP